MFIKKTPAVSKIHIHLLRWYSNEKRDLPFRYTRDPYKIWVSEIMLQQTQVQTVIPYYNKFIAKFPTVSSLANASLEEVLSLWQGLGYYSRARNLHGAAQTIVSQYTGQLPTSSQELLKLKGFGPYTSAAVASIAFNEPIVAIDGNVKRVVSRLYIENKNVEQLSQNLKHPSNSRDFNQSLMELGALICLPKNPKCNVCPLQKICLAFQTERVRDFPLKSKKTKVTRLYHYVFYVEHENQVRIQQRPNAGRWAGLWELPQLETQTLLNFKDIQTQAKLLGLTGIQKVNLPKFTHNLTHQKINVEIYTAKTSTKKISLHWQNKNDLHKKPFSILQKKILKALKLF